MGPPATAQRTYQLLENESLWETARRVDQLLREHRIAYAIVGGVATCLHGYRRNTTGLDVLIRPEDAETFRAILEAGRFTWDPASHEFRSESGIPVQVLLAGDREGSGLECRFPDPSAPHTVATVEGLPVLTLSQLIQSKIASGMGNLRRTHKDFADVVELIVVNRLDGSFVRFLHKSVRKEFRRLVKHAAGG